MKAIIFYFLSSCMATVVDVSIGWFLYIGMGLPILFANTIGIIAGFLIDYKLSTRFVFRTKGSIKSLTIYLTTFLLGLVLANTIIYWGTHVAFAQCPMRLSYLLSKVLSMGIPFFILYFLRKKLYARMK